MRLTQLVVPLQVIAPAALLELLVPSGDAAKEDRRAALIADGIVTRGLDAGGFAFDETAEVGEVVEGPHYRFSAGAASNMQHKRRAFLGKASQSSR